MWHLNSVHINSSLNPFPASMASVMDPIWFTWPHVNLKITEPRKSIHNWFLNEWKLSTFLCDLPMPSARAHCKLRLPRPAQQRGIIQDVSSMFVLQVIVIHVFHTLTVPKKHSYNYGTNYVAYHMLKWLFILSCLFISHDFFIFFPQNYAS